MFILNIDDDYNIHQRNQLTLIQTHNIYHFVIILLNINIKILTILLYSLDDILIYNPKGIDSELIINNININFINQLRKHYFERKELWK